jgi:hypothetical protein
MPRQPLTSYFLFYHKKCDQILAENPTFSMAQVSEACVEKWEVIEGLGVGGGVLKVFLQILDRGVL